MITSNKGIELIKSFEGLRLVAYKAVPTEKYWTIGYGHYGADVSAGQAITVEQATELLRKDLKKFEDAVNKYVNTYKFNQNQFDALVSFTYNCGAGNLNNLTKNGTRSIKEINNSLPNYNKAGGKVLKGLVRRRQAELDLFNTPVNDNVIVVPTMEYKAGVYRIKASALRVRSGAGTNYSVAGSSLPKNKEVAVNEILYTNDGVWGKICNGYIAIKIGTSTYAEYVRENVVYTKVVEYSKVKHGNNSISKNFKIKEFASKDGVDKILIDLILVEQLQKIRDHFNSPLNINSGYRSASHNAKVGGVKNSYHTQGRACDIRVNGITPLEVARYAESIGVRGIGLYDNFVHVDTRDSKYKYKYRNGNYIKQDSFK